MGLFKDFKEDFSQAVNEMMPGTDVPQKQNKAEDLVVNTLGEDVDVKSELSKLDGLLEQVQKDDGSDTSFASELPPIHTEEKKVDTKPVVETPTISPIINPFADNSFDKDDDASKGVAEDTMSSVMNDTKEDPFKNNTLDNIFKNEENKIMSDTTMGTPKPTTPVMDNSRVNPAAASDETSVITAGTVLTGDLTSDGSFEIQGTINGNVTCNGKLNVTGTINGNSAASEVFADVAKIEGEVVSSGTVKIGAGSVIIGNISAASAVIAGAIKGDIDVQGPVVVDTSAVVMGNIKSRSVQINNGAVIEGFCSQCYADIDVQGLFDGK